MVKAKKAKWRIEENTREGFTRYSIRKYSMGVASVYCTPKVRHEKSNFWGVFNEINL